jgi:predicted nuclease with TOPRIM domain
MINEWTKRLEELEANNTFLMQYRDRLIGRIKELEEERDGFRNGQEQAQFLLNGVMDANANLDAYNKKLLDENIILLNERNEARIFSGNDVEMVALIQNLLSFNPWPTVDMRWQTIDVWTKDVIKRAQQALKGEPIK